MSEPGNRILCVGLSCLDILSYIPRFPDEDSQLLVTDQRWSLGGNATNNATVLQQVGVEAELFTALAQDAVTSPIVLHQLRLAGVDTRPSVVRPRDAFPVSTAIINDANGSRTILHRRSGITEPTLHEFKALDLGRYAWIHFEGRNKDEVRGMLDWAREQPHRPRLSVEVEKLYPGLEALIPGADVVFLSKDFARDRGLTDMTAAVRGAASRWASPGASVICAWGEEGAAALDGVTRVVSTAPAYPPAKVVDTLGAGDTFVGATLAALMRKTGLGEAIEFGCRVAGAKVGQKGLLNIPSVLL